MAAHSLLACCSLHLPCAAFDSQKLHLQLALAGQSPEDPEKGGMAFAAMSPRLGPALSAKTSSAIPHGQPISATYTSVALI